MKKFLAFLVILAISGFIYYSINYVDNDPVDYSEINEDYNDELKDLKDQKQELLQEMSKYRVDYDVPNMGSVVFLLTDIDKRHLDNTVYDLESNGYIGVIAISAKEMPNNDGTDNMTKSEILELVNLGYEVVISIQEGEDANEVYNKFIEEGYDVKGFYLKDTNVGFNTIEDIKNLGDMAIIGDFGEYEDEDFLIINKYGNLYSNVQNKFYDSVKKSNTIAISIGFDEDEDEEYEYVNFTTLLNIINTYVDNSNTDVCNITDARKRYVNYLKQLDSIASEDRDKVKELKKKIAELDKQIIFGANND